MTTDGEAMGLRIGRDETIRPNPRSTFRELTEGSGGVLLHLDTAAYHGLNEIGVAIWNLIQPGITFGGLIEELRARIPDAPPTLDDEIATFLGELHDRDLVVIGDAR